MSHLQLKGQYRTLTSTYLWGEVGWQILLFHGFPVVAECSWVVLLHWFHSATAYNSVYLRPLHCWSITVSQHVIFHLSFLLGLAYQPSIPSIRLCRWLVYCHEFCGHCSSGRRDLCWHKGSPWRCCQLSPSEGTTVKYYNYDGAFLFFVGVVGLPVKPP